MRYISIVIIFLTLFSCNSSKKGFSFLPSDQKLNEVEIADQYYIEATKEKNLENYDKAIELYKKCLKYKGDHAPVYYEIANIYYTQKKFNEADNTLSKAIELNPNNKWFHILQINISKVLRNSKKMEEAYLKIVEIEPNNPDHFFELANFYIQIKDYKKAINVYNQIEEKIGPSELVNKKKYIMHHQLKNYSKAHEELDKLIKDHPTQMEYYQYKGDVFIDEGKDDEALRNFHNALSIAPNDVFIFNELAGFYYGKSNLDSSLFYYQKVMNDISFPGKEKVTILKMLLRRDAQNDDLKPKVENLLDSAVNKHNSNFRLTELAGSYYFETKNYSKAQKYYDKAVRLNLNSYNSWRSLILSNFNAHDYIKMKSNAIDANELFPAQAEMYYYAGLAHYKLKEFKYAKTYLEQGAAVVVGNKPLKIQFYSLLADIHNELKEFEESDSYFEKSLTLDSTDAFIMNNYAYYLSLRQDKLERAESLSKKSNSIMPNNGSFQDTYGWILFQMKDYGNALEWLLKAEQNSPESAVISEHIGDTYKMLNDLNKAKFYWKKALDLDKNNTELINKLKH